MRDVFAVDQNLPAAGGFKTRNHAQGGGLAAPRGAEQGCQTAFGNNEVNALDHEGGTGRAVTLADLPKFNAVDSRWHHRVCMCL